MDVLTAALGLLVGLVAGSYGALALSAYSSRTKADVLRMLTEARHASQHATSSNRPNDHQSTARLNRIPPPTENSP